AVEHDAAGVGRHQADDHVEAGGLARAVGAEQADDFAGVEGQAETAHHLARPVAPAQPFGHQHLGAIPVAVARQDPHLHPAAAFAAALDAAGLQVVDHAPAAHAAARLFDADVAGEHDDLGLEVVVDVVGARFHRRTVVHLLAHDHRAAAEHRAHDLAAGHGQACGLRV